ncbi:AraC family transcriptional regulator [Algoriphagus sp. A40]|uniref:helix-turn-helix domain-containing protein n=1 Tax=Algoriphagus sp. A40 TaxID=1945863 RepID=UPI00098464B2|nr:AraC family transcriptional regulator [Algoriphagus sp. A40]OOG73009.1 hypothetical protein B0E43_13865 [Algoriphagus sp. A40]
MKVKSELIEKMEQAKNLLESKLQNPPSIAELAHLVGLNETYLKIHFKAIFANTVYGFVKKRRIQKAIQLLKEGKLNISEIGWEVGYRHPTHFSAAFKKETGCTPKEYSRDPLGGKF